MKFAVTRKGICNKIQKWSAIRKIFIDFRVMCERIVLEDVHNDLISRFNEETPATCDDGWVKSEVTGSCYLITEDEYTWSDGASYCNSFIDASMVQIDSTHEQDYLAGISNIIFIVIKAHLGCFWLTDKKSLLLS